MEFRCRLGTPGGDIIEGIYVADNEARLRLSEQRRILRDYPGFLRPVGGAE